MAYQIVSSTNPNQALRLTLKREVVPDSTCSGDPPAKIRRSMANLNRTIQTTHDMNSNPVQLPWNMQSGYQPALVLQTPPPIHMTRPFNPAAMYGHMSPMQQFGQAPQAVQPQATLLQHSYQQRAAPMVQQSSRMPRRPPAVHTAARATMQPPALPPRAAHLDYWNSIVKKPMRQDTALEILRFLAPDANKSHVTNPANQNTQAGGSRRSAPPPALGRAPHAAQQPDTVPRIPRTSTPSLAPVHGNQNIPTISDSPPIIVQTDPAFEDEEVDITQCSPIPHLLDERDPPKTPPTEICLGIKPPPTPLTFVPQNSTTKPSTPKSERRPYPPGYPKPYILCQRDLHAADLDLAHILQAALRLRAWLSVVRHQMHGSE